MKLEPWTHAYRLLGDRIGRILPHFQELHGDLKKGGINIAFEAYLSLMIEMSLIVAIISSVVLFVVSPLIFKYNILTFGNFILSLMLSSLSLVLSFIIFNSYPKIKSSNRRYPIEINLPYISNFLALLSSSNVAPKKIFQSVATIDTLSEVQQEFSNIVRDTEVFGQDILTSILENVKYTPCKKLREILTGYVAAIRTGGDSTKYLEISTENIMKERMVNLDVMLESLSALAEIYIIVLVAMPLLFVVMFVTFAMLGGGGEAMNLMMMLYLLTYVGIPVMATILILVISTFAVR